MLETVLQCLSQYLNNSINNHMKDYFKLCGFNDGVKAAMVSAMLEEKDIPVNIINKQDSNYVFLGESELWIPLVFKEEALQALKEIQLN